MQKLTEKINELLNGYTREQCLKSLSEVVRDFDDLDVAANLIEKDIDPSFLMKRDFEEHWYTEGNEEMGHVKLKSLLKSIEEVLNADDSEANMSFNRYLTREYTQSELEEEGKLNDGIVWHKSDEEQPVDDTLIGFEVD